MADASTSAADAPPKRSSLLERRLTAMTMAGVALGVSVGVLCQALTAPRSVVVLLKMPGRLWIRALKAMVVPMIFASMVLSTSGSSAGTGRMSTLAVRFYLATTVIAALEGIIAFNLFSSAFRPLDDDAPSNSTADQEQVAIGTAAEAAAAPNHHNVGETLLDTLVTFGDDLVPENIFAAFANTQLLGVVSFGIFFGAMLGRSASPSARVLVQLFDAVYSTLVEMVKLVCLLTPIGVGSLVGGAVAAHQDLPEVLRNLGSLVGVALLAHATHTFVVYSALYWSFTRKSVRRFYLGLIPAWLTAFATRSSAAALATTTRCCEQMGISHAVTSYVLPIGCTINMDGSALERPLVVLWIAHTAGMPVSAGGQLLVAFVSTLLSVGSSPIPFGGYSTLAVMVETARVPPTPQVELLLGFALSIEWFLDSFRTAVNVTGDAVGVAIIDHILRAPKGGTTAGGAELMLSADVHRSSDSTPQASLQMGELAPGSDGLGSGSGEPAPAATTPPGGARPSPLLPGVV